MEKKKIKTPEKKEEKKEFNDHPTCQHFLCWLDSWMLLVKGHRNCLTGLNLRTWVPGTPLATGISQGFSRVGYHGSCHLCCRGAEKNGRSSLLTPCGMSFWPKAQVGHSQSVFACPAPSAVDEHEAPWSSGRCNQSFPRWVSQQPVPRSCDTAINLWERL